MIKIEELDEKKEFVAQGYWNIFQAMVANDEPACLFWSRRGCASDHPFRRDMDRYGERCF